MRILNNYRIKLMLTVLAAGSLFATGSLAFANESERTRPIADAGPSRYAGPDPVVLDGTGSYDPDGSGTLSYTWKQIAGPSTIIIDANTATPSIGQETIHVGRGSTLTLGGFTQTDEIQECQFELIVSDGELTSATDTVKVIIVPDFGANKLIHLNPPFDPDKPTWIYIGGLGGCQNVGSRPAWFVDYPEGYVGDVILYEKVNHIFFEQFHLSSTTIRQISDMLIVYLSSHAPDYKQPIQSHGGSAGGQPAIDIGIYLNETYADARYAVNRVSLFDATGWTCRNFRESIDRFLASAVDGEQCWIDSYQSTLPHHHEDKISVGFHPNVLNIWFDAANYSSATSYLHELPDNFYGNSLIDSNLQEFNHGLVAGPYWSVIGPGKNLQLASTPGVETYKFIWYGDAYSGYMDFYDEPNHPGRLPEPVTLIGPTDGAMVDANGVILSCEVSENAVGYQLLFGSEPYRVMDYTMVSDTPEPPAEVITTFPFEQTFWTVRVYDKYGSTIYADPICIYPEIVVDSSKKLVAYWKLDETDGDIAYDSAGNNDATVYNGVWTAGKVDGALDFNGLNTYVDCGESELLGPEQMTISMWIKPEHMGGMRYILSRAKTDSDDIDYNLQRHYEGEVEFDIGQADSQPVSVLSNSTTPLNEWSHVAVSLDGSAASIFINGRLDSSAGYGQRLPRESYWFVISSLKADTRYYNGMIDDVRIYNYALSEDEIKALVN